MSASVQISADIEPEITIQPINDPSSVIKVIDEIILKNVERNQLISKMFKDDMSELKTFRKDYNKMVKNVGKVESGRSENMNVTSSTPTVSTTLLSTNDTQGDFHSKKKPRVFIERILSISFGFSSSKSYR